MVCAGREKLVDQVAIGTVDLHAVEAGLDRIRRRAGVIPIVRAMSSEVIARGVTVSAGPLLMKGK